MSARASAEGASGRAGYHARGAVLAILASLGLAACAATTARFEFAEPRLGTEVSLVLWAPDPQRADEAARDAYARIDVLDRVLSDWRPDSELNDLCRAAPGTPVAVSDDLWNVLLRADAVVRASDGAFDPTVGPFVRLWRRARRERELPSEARLADAATRVGWRELVRLSPDGHRVELRRAGMRLDLGGIAKGYIADAALARLREHGITRALVDAGGDLSLGAAPPRSDGWRVGLEAPGDGGARTTIAVSSCGVATSGDAFQFVEIDGVRYSHLVDPRTGLGLVGAGQVTAVAADGVTADALASALSVVGPDRAAAVLAHFPGASARFQWPGDGGVHEIVTAGFPPGAVAARADAR